VFRLQETKGLWEQQAASPDLTSPPTGRESVADKRQSRD